MDKSPMEKKLERLQAEVGATQSNNSLRSLHHIAWKSSADMLSGVIIGTGGGLLWDYFYGTSPWGLIFGFILGSGSGLLNVYRGLCKVGYGFKKKKEPNG